MPIHYKPVKKTATLKATKNQVYHAKTIANGTLDLKIF